MIHKKPIQKGPKWLKQVYPGVLSSATLPSRKEERKEKKIGKGGKEKKNPIPSIFGFQ